MISLEILITLLLLHFLISGSLISLISLSLTINVQKAQETRVVKLDES